MLRPVALGCNSQHNFCDEMFQGDLLMFSPADISSMLDVEFVYLLF